MERSTLPAGFGGFANSLRCISPCIINLSEQHMTFIVAETHVDPDPPSAAALADAAFSRPSRIIAASVHRAEKNQNTFVAAEPPSLSAGRAKWVCNARGVERGGGAPQKAEGLEGWGAEPTVEDSQNAAGDNGGAQRLRHDHLMHPPIYLSLAIAARAAPWQWRPPSAAIHPGIERGGQARRTDRAVLTAFPPISTPVVHRKFPIAQKQPARIPAQPGGPSTLIWKTDGEDAIVIVSHGARGRGGGGGGAVVGGRT